MDKLVRRLRGSFKGEIEADAGRIVVFPVDIQDLKVLVRAVADERVKDNPLILRARGAGTDGRSDLPRNCVTVDFVRHFNRIKESSTDRIVAEPGAFFRDIEREAAEHGAFLPPYPPSRDVCTAGGMVAVDATGERSFRYGDTAAYVTELKAVLQDGNEYILRRMPAEDVSTKRDQTTFEGEVYRRINRFLAADAEGVRAAAANDPADPRKRLMAAARAADGSLDLSRLVVGSHGTLGLITEIAFRLERIPAARVTLLIELRDATKVGMVRARIAEHLPDALESYDRPSMLPVRSSLVDLARKIALSPVKRLIRLVRWGWMSLVGTLPSAIVLAGFSASSEDEAFAAARLALNSLRHIRGSARIIESPDEAELEWAIWRETSRSRPSQARLREPDELFAEVKHIFDPHGMWNAEVM